MHIYDECRHNIHCLQRLVDHQQEAVRLVRFALEDNLPKAELDRCLAALRDASMHLYLACTEVHTNGMIDARTLHAVDGHATAARVAVANGARGGAL